MRQKQRVGSLGTSPHPEPAGLPALRRRGQKVVKHSCCCFCCHHGSGDLAFLFLFFSLPSLFAFLYLGGWSLGPSLASRLSHPLPTLISACLARAEVEHNRL